MKNLKIDLRGVVVAIVEGPEGLCVLDLVAVGLVALGDEGPEVLLHRARVAADHQLP